VLLLLLLWLPGAGDKSGLVVWTISSSFVLSVITIPMSVRHNSCLCFGNLIMTAAHAVYVVFNFAKLSVITAFMLVRASWRQLTVFFTPRRVLQLAACTCPNNHFVN
jgi:hypothetical protein